MKDGRLAADLFRALGHPIRLEILETLLAEGEVCVCHLESRLGLRQAYLSQHLARLRQVGLVVDRREGLNVFYRPTSAAIGGLLEAGGRLEAALGSTGEARQTQRAVRDQGERACPCPRCQEAEHRGATGVAVAFDAAGG